MRSPANSGQRIGLGVTTLLAAVASHLTLIGQLPPVGYLTLADKIMITAYGLFLYSLAVSVLAMRKVDQNDMEAANQVNRRARIALPLVTLFLLLPLLAVA